MKVAPSAEVARLAALARRAEELELAMRRRVEGTLVGRYRSVFRGRGIDLDQVREYVPGDDVRCIDWNVTARTGRPFVKQHVEERQRTLLLVVDASASTELGSAGRDKRGVMAELACALALLASGHEDRVGLVLFTDRVERFVPPGRGRAHVLRVVHAILATEPRGVGTDVPQALEAALTLLRRRALVVLLSDFLASGDPVRERERLRRTCAHLGLRHEVLALRVHDPREEALPDVGLLTLEDPETGALVELDTARSRVRARFAALAGAELRAIDATLREAGVDVVPVSTERDPLTTLAAYLERRGGRA